MSKKKIQPIITKKLFNKEVEMCKKLNAKDGGCLWGRCDTCGVIPLLYKLKTGELVHGEELEKLRKEVFSKGSK